MEAIVGSGQQDDVVKALAAVGFTSYEARVYRALLTGSPATAYEISKVSGVPHAKVYETVRRLGHKSVVRQTGDRRFEAKRQGVVVEHPGLAPAEVDPRKIFQRPRKHPEQIADRLDNWSMRERVFTLQHTRWERAQSSTGFDIPCVIDTDDVRVIAGTMGRFPTFRDTGWRILQSAQIVDGN